MLINLLEIVPISKKSFLICKKIKIFSEFFIFFLNFLSFRIEQFTEKIQEQLYVLANNLVKSSILGGENENENLNKNIISIQNLNIEKTR